MDSPVAEAKTKVIAAMWTQLACISVWINCVNAIVCTVNWLCRLSHIDSTVRPTDNVVIQTNFTTLISDSDADLFQKIYAKIMNHAFLWCTHCGSLFFVYFPQLGNGRGSQTIHRRRHGWMVIFGPWFQIHRHLSGQTHDRCTVRLPTHQNGAFVQSKFGRWLNPRITAQPPK